MKYFSVLLLWLCMIQPAAGQFNNHNILAYYRFDSTNADRDSGPLGLNLRSNQVPVTISSNGLVGKYLDLKTDSLRIRTGTIPANSQHTGAITMEALVRPGAYFHGGNILNFQNRAVLEFDGRRFRAILYFTDGTSIQLQVPLSGIGRRSPDYYLDGRWHHLVMVADTNTATLRLFVDGICPQGFSQYFCGGKSLRTSHTLFLSEGNPPWDFQGGLDEIAIYNEALHPDTIQQHFRRANLNQPYFSGPALAPVVLYPGYLRDNQYNPFDFPDGYPDKIQGNALEQLRRFPGPRYRPGHQLPPLVSHVNKLRKFHPKDSISDVVTQGFGAKIMEEMALHYNYGIVLGSPRLFTAPKIADPNTREHQRILLANTHPNLPIIINMGWGNVDQDTSTGGPYLKHQNFNDAYYPQDINGQVLTRKYLSWEVATDPNKALFLTLDGIKQAENLRTLRNSLTRPNPEIDLILERNEQIQDRGQSVIQNDSLMNAARGTLTANQYESARGLAFRMLYQQPILDSIATIFGSPTSISVYNIWGSEKYSHFEYDTIRYGNGIYRGFRRSTPFYYPQKPWYWRTGITVLTGMGDITQSRYIETDTVGQTRDTLFMPYVGPGYIDDNGYFVIDTAMNRPGQFLGQLKILAALGADTYALFEANEFEPFSKTDPQIRWDGNWRSWKLVMPAYAQGTFSRAEDLLKDRSLLRGDINYAPYSGTNPSTSVFFFSTGDLNDAVVVRKAPGQERYLITGSIQRYVNDQSVGLKEKVVEIKVATSNGLKSFKFPIRQQGSVYRYDSTGSNPTFIQLDRWHQWQSPSYWSLDLPFEAEVFDDSSGQISIETERPVNAAPHDYSSFTSYMKFSSGNPSHLDHQFLLRDYHRDSLYLWVRARSASTSGNTSLTMQLLDSNNTFLNVGTISGITGTNWSWYTLAANAPLASNLPSASGLHTLRTIAGNSNLELDRILLQRKFYNPNAPLTNGTLTGPTSLCVSDTAHFSLASGVNSQELEWYWDFDDGIRVFDSGMVHHKFPHPGTFMVRLTLKNPVTAQSQKDSFQVTVNGADVDAGPDHFIYPGGSVNLQGQVLNSTALAAWSPVSGLTNHLTLNPTASPTSTTTYTLTAANGSCGFSDTVTVHVQETGMKKPFDTLGVCQGQLEALFIPYGFNHQWEPNSLLSTFTGTSPVAGPIDTITTFYCYIQDSCGNLTDTLNLTLLPTVPTNFGILTGDTSTCPCEAITLEATPGAYKYNWEIIDPINQHQDSVNNTTCNKNLLYSPKASTPTLYLVRSAQVAVKIVIDSAIGCTVWDTITVAANPICCSLPWIRDTLSNTSASSLINSTGTSSISNSTFMIEGQFTVDDDLYFKNCYFVLKPGASIKVNANQSLRSERNIYYPSCDTLWEGIQVYHPSARLISVADSIQGAKTAIHSRFGGRISIDRSRFDLNNTHIRIDHDTSSVDTVPAMITGTSFWNSNPSFVQGGLGGIAPTYTGIKVDSVVNVRIGEPGSSPNYFQDLVFGIRIDSSNASLLNNVFSKIRPLPNSGTLSPPSGAIVANGKYSPVPAHGLQLRIGNQNLAQSGNQFYDCETGIGVFQNYAVTLDSNYFEDIDSRGIYIVSTANKHHRIRDNRFWNNKIALNGALWLGCRADIQGNDIESINYTRPSTGIKMDIAYGDTNNNNMNLLDSLYRIKIRRNQIRVLGNGIWLNASRFVSVSENYIQTRTHNDTLAYGYSHGLIATGGQFIQAKENNIETHGLQWLSQGVLDPTHTWMRGMYFYLSKGADLRCNTISEYDRGMVFEGDCSSAYLRNNTFGVCQVQLELREFGRIDDQGDINTQSGNVWLPGPPGSLNLWGTYVHNSRGPESEFFHNPIIMNSFPTDNRSNIPSAYPPIPFQGVQDTSIIAIPCDASHLSAIQNNFSITLNQSLNELEAGSDGLSKHQIREKTIWILNAVSTFSFLAMEPELQAFRETQSEQNAGTYVNSLSSLTTGDFVLADAFIQKLEPGNEEERTQKQILQFLSKKAKGLPLDEVEISTLLSITDRCAKDFGEVIFLAQSLFSIFISSDAGTSIPEICND